jgi:hypothetical protein
VGCVWGQGTVVIVGAGVVDLCNHEIIGRGNVAALREGEDREGIAFAVVGEEAGMRSCDGRWWSGGS